MDQAPRAGPPACWGGGGGVYQDRRKVVRFLYAVPRSPGVTPLRMRSAVFLSISIIPHSFRTCFMHFLFKFKERGCAK